MKIYTSKLINKTVSIKAPKYSHRTFTTLQLYENCYYSYIYEPCTYNNFILTVKCESNLKFHPNITNQCQNKYVNYIRQFSKNTQTKYASCLVPKWPFIFSK
jgi:hypothetical protein